MLTTTTTFIKNILFKAWVIAIAPIKLRIIPSLEAYNFIETGGDLADSNLFATFLLFAFFSALLIIGVAFSSYRSSDKGVTTTLSVVKLSQKPTAHLKVAKAKVSQLVSWVKSYLK